MRRLIALLVVLALTLTSGCTVAARKNRGIGFIADATVAAGFLTLQGTDDCEAAPWMEDPYGVSRVECVDDVAGAGVGAGLLLAGVVLGAAILAMETPDVAREMAEDADPPLPPRAESRVDDPILRLARGARTAALAGDCEAADQLLAAVARRDPGYHAALVASDAVAACR